MTDEGKLRYRVKVANPPHEPHKGFVVWAKSPEEAKQRVRKHGYSPLTVVREEIAV